MGKKHVDCLVVQNRFQACGVPHGMHCDYITITKNALCKSSQQTFHSLHVLTVIEPYNVAIINKCCVDNLIVSVFYTTD